MEASKTLIEKIKEFEGFSNTAYTCPAGVWTCGFGHTKNVTATTTCTRQEAEKWLRQDLIPAVKYVNTIPEIDTQGKFDAVVDFIYNLGEQNFKSSTLYKKIKSQAKTSEIVAEFKCWVYGGGKKLPGLVKRREWESKRWQEIE